MSEIMKKKTDKNSLIVYFATVITTLVLVPSALLIGVFLKKDLIEHSENKIMNPVSVLKYKANSNR